MQKIYLLVGCIIGGLSVVIGAFGAHALKTKLQEYKVIEVFETAVKYQFYHSIALILLGLLLFKIQHRFLTYAGNSFMIGILIFSGSLYLLCLTNQKWLGAITPIGGVFLILGWAFMSLAIYKTL